MKNWNFNKILTVVKTWILFFIISLNNCNNVVCLRLKETKAIGIAGIGIHKEQIINDNNQHELEKCFRGIKTHGIDNNY